LIGNPSARKVGIGSMTLCIWGNGLLFFMKEFQISMSLVFEFYFLSLNLIGTNRKTMCYHTSQQKEINTIKEAFQLPVKACSHKPSN